MSVQAERMARYRATGTSVPSTPITFELERTAPPGEWISQAACAASDTAVFFVHAGQDPQPARTICNHCPVKQHCLDYALGAGDSLHGIWGATTHTERRSIRRRRRSAA